MVKFAGSVSALVLALVAPSAQAQDAQTLAAKFGALEAVQQISLSPDGTKVVYIAPDARYGTVAYQADLTGQASPKMIIASHGKEEQLYRCDWTTNTRLVCNIHVVYDAGGQLLGFTRAFALNADGADVARLTVDPGPNAIGFSQSAGQVIDWNVPGKPGSVLMTRTQLEESQTTLIASTHRPGLGVDEVDTVTLKRKPVEAPRPNAVEFYSDGNGQVRVMGTMPTKTTGYMGNKISYFYRQPNSTKWEELSKVGLEELSAGFDPYAVDSVKNVAYGFDDKDGYTALYSIALDGTGTKQVVLSRPGVDVDGLIRIGKAHRVVGASYAEERRISEFFDPELKKLSAALGKALPGKPAVEFVDASSDEGKLLLLATSDTDPGKFYLFDKKTRSLGEVLPVRPQLAGQAMAPMQSITFPAADGTQIPAYLTLPPGSSGKGIPAIVMPHGGPGARDEWGFDWLVQFFAARGFAVIQPNFRGSTGYGSAWYQKNGFKSWRTSVGDVDDAGRWLIKQGIAAPDKLGIVGWSYGGYAALQGSVLDPKLFKAVVAIAPVTDLERLRGDSRDFSNFPLVDKYIGIGPHIREGSPAQNAGAIIAPVLMFHGDIDQNVSIGQSRLMRDKLQAAGKQVQLIEFPGLKHNLGDSAARARVLYESDQFLRKAMGLAPN